MNDPHEQYTIRRQFFKLFGAAFHVYDHQGQLAGYCKQKAFKLREDIRLFTDESQTTPLLTLKARQIIDFAVTFDVLLPSGSPLCSLRRKGLMSTFVRDEWIIFDSAGQPAASIKERGSILPILRRFTELTSLFFPQRFDVISTTNAPIAAFRQHFNPFIYRLGIAITAPDETLDELAILAAACLISAIEGRQG
jgi:uncharacterized protein YxjI